MVSPRDTWLIQLRAQRAAARVLALFGEAGIDALPVKGIITSRTLYPDVAERILTDVDIKVRPEDFRRVVRLARREGWPIYQLLHTYGNVVFRVDGVDVDVETHVSAPWLCALTVDDLIARARPSQLLGVPHLVPELHDHGAVLVFNAFKDKMVGAFAWALRDLELLVEQREFDVATFVDRLRRSAGLTIGAVVADWMITKRHAAAWVPVRAAIGEGGARNEYVRAHRALVARFAHDGLIVRAHTRGGVDARWRRALALATAMAFSVEARLPGTVFAR